MRYLFLILCILSFSSSGVFASELLSPEDIAAESRIILDSVKNMKLEELLPGRQVEPTEDQKKNAAEILAISQDVVNKAMAEEAEKLELDDLTAANLPEDRVIVFITLGEAPDYSHGRKMLNALLGMPNDIVVVIRGLPDTVRQFDKATRVINGLVGKDFTDLPPVVLDPVRFKKYEISQSPTLVFERNEEEVARLSGQLSYNYLKEKVEEGFEGDLGQFGDTITVVEKDFIDDLKERMSQIDWEEKTNKARNRFWKKKELFKLPPAPEDRTFSVTPEFELTQDIVDHEWNVVIGKGERINVLAESLKLNPTRFYLIIFDGSNTAQVKIAKRLAAAAPKDHRTILITTTLADLDHGWDELPKLQDQFKAAVYVLDDRFVKTFDLQHVPCTVRPSETEYIIQEYRRTL